MKTKFATFPLATALAVITAPMTGAQSNDQPGFSGGFPTEETAQRAQDEGDYERAVQAYQFFFPTISMEGIFQGTRDAGVQDNKGALIFSCGPRDVMFTANADTPYLWAVFNLKESGPMVVELPPGPYIGLFDDHNFRYTADVGLTGADAGKGGKHLVLPPDYKGEPPAGYDVARSPTYFVILAARSVPVRGDIKGALNSLRKIKVYPLSQSANPPAFAFVDKSDQPIDITPLKWENNLQYWQKLHKVLQEEPVLQEFRPMYGLLAALGIEKGKPFAPDERMKGILDRAAIAGHDRLMVASYASPRPDRIVWPDRKWEWVALVDDNGDFETTHGIDLPARDRWFAQATGASPKMFGRKPGAGSLYWLGMRDRDGAYLDGGKTYKLSVPQPVPQKLFWSVTVYDPRTRSMIQTDQGKAALGSLVELKNVPKTGSTDLYFGPKAPAGKESQWIQTNPGQGWFAYFRLFGPEGPAFDGSWKPGDFEAMEEQQLQPTGRQRGSQRPEQ